MHYTYISLSPSISTAGVLKVVIQYFFGPPLLSFRLKQMCTYLTRVAAVRPVLFQKDYDLHDRGLVFLPLR